MIKPKINRKLIKLSAGNEVLPVRFQFSVKWKNRHNLIIFATVIENPDSDKDYVQTRGVKKMWWSKTEKTEKWFFFVLLTIN